MRIVTRYDSLPEAEVDSPDSGGATKPFWPIERGPEQGMGLLKDNL
jgi:hypothetical protein